MPRTAIEINVLGTSIPVSVDEEPEYLEHLLKVYKNKITEIQNVTGLSNPLKSAILTGFSLCDECEKARKASRENEENNKKAADKPDHDETERLTLSLISRLDNILASDEDIESAKKHIYKLHNVIKDYDWGSKDWIPELINMKNDKNIPCAELWMGVHPEGPSKIIPANCEASANQDSSPEVYQELRELIEKNPAAFLGEEKAHIFGTLPFLFKALAAEKPLSIQAHPSLAQAREGWSEENEKGIPVTAPNRNYKDANHKPEILCALQPFTAMAGFREPLEIKNLLELFLSNASYSLKISLKPLLFALEENAPLKKFLGLLFSLSPQLLDALNSYALEQGAQGNPPAEWKYIAQFAAAYPRDPAIISPLYLNLIHLDPGEAIFLPAGILHAYVYGLGMELMANSDNVLRGGLTSKYIDIPELMHVLDFSPFKPEIIKGIGDASGEYEYPVPSREFSLSVIKGGENIYLETGPSIIFVTEGKLTINTPASAGGINMIPEIILEKGESAFIPAGNKGLIFSGGYTLYTAGIGLITNADSG